MHKISTWKFRNILRRRVASAPGPLAPRLPFIDLPWWALILQKSFLRALLPFHFLNAGGTREIYWNISVACDGSFLVPISGITKFVSIPIKFKNNLCFALTFKNQRKNFRKIWTTNKGRITWHYCTYMEKVKA